MPTDLELQRIRGLARFKAQRGLWPARKQPPRRRRRQPAKDARQ